MISVVALIAGVVWAGLVDQSQGTHRLQLFVAALLIIGGLCGLLVTLVHSINANA
jgi:hypothetical protein